METNSCRLMRPAAVRDDNHERNVGFSCGSICQHPCIFGSAFAKSLCSRRSLSHSCETCRERIRKHNGRGLFNASKKRYCSSVAINCCTERYRSNTEGVLTGRAIGRLFSQARNRRFRARTQLLDRHGRRGRLFRDDIEISWDLSFILSLIHP